MSTILVVDDDQKIAMSLCVRLRASGHEVRVAHDGMMAVSQAVKFEPDLIILDINMPCGNGLTAAERIGNLAGTAGTPVVFITASKDPALRQQAASLNAAGFLEKPFVTQELLQIVDRALGRAA